MEKTLIELVRQIMTDIADVKQEVRELRLLMIEAELTGAADFGEGADSGEATDPAEAADFGDAGDFGDGAELGEGASLSEVISENPITG